MNKEILNKARKQIDLALNSENPKKELMEARSLLSIVENDNTGIGEHGERLKRSIEKLDLIIESLERLEISDPVILITGSNKIIRFPTYKLSHLHLLDLFTNKAHKTENGFCLKPRENKPRTIEAGVLFPEIVKENWLDVATRKFFNGETALALKHLLGLISLYTEFTQKTGFAQNQDGSNHNFIWTPKAHLIHLRAKKKTGSRAYQKSEIATAIEFIEILYNLEVEETDLLDEAKGSIYNLIYLVKKPTGIITRKSVNDEYIIRLGEWYNLSSYQDIPDTVLSYDAKSERHEIYLAVKFYRDSKASMGRPRDYTEKTLLNFLGIGNNPKKLSDQRKRLKAALHKLQKDGLIIYSVTESKKTETMYNINIPEKYRFEVIKPKKTKLLN